MPSFDITISPVEHEELVNPKNGAVSRNSPRLGDVTGSGASEDPLGTLSWIAAQLTRLKYAVQSAVGVSCSPPDDTQPRASHKHRQRAGPRTLPLRAWVVDTKVSPAAASHDPGGMRR